VDEDVPSAEFPFGQFIELREVPCDILRFHVEQGIDDVRDGRVELYLFHSCCCRDDCLIDGVPVVMRSLLMESVSSAAETSPRCSALPDC
jgi:hypothetical protein